MRRFLNVLGGLVLIIGAGALFYFGWVISREEAARMAAQAEEHAGPIPAVVDVTDFLNTAKLASPGGEVHLRSQLHLDNVFQLSASGNHILQQHRHVIFGHSIDETDPKGRVRIAYFFDQKHDFDAFIERFLVGQGPISPIVEVNGKVLDLHSDFESMIRDGARDNRITLSSLLVVEPFFNGRDTDYAPPWYNITLVVFWGMGVLLLILGISMIRRRPS